MSKEMTAQEADKIIAEFMFGDKFQYFVGDYLVILNNSPPYKRYSKSIDALVPVWEKLEVLPYLGIRDGLFQENSCQLYEHILDDEENEKSEYMLRAKGETIQEAAAIATAKAILELNEGNK